MILIPTASDLADILECLRRRRPSLRHVGRIPQSDRELLRQADLIHRNLGDLPLRALRLLVELKFTLPPGLRAWLPNYLRLTSFRRRHGHLQIPRRPRRMRHLNRWLHKQQNGEKTRTTIQIQLLDRLDGSWRTALRPGLGDMRWNSQYQKLKEFKAVHGHCQVTREETQDLSLAMWVANQRANGRRRGYPASRRAFLDALGFDWTPLKNAWQTRYQELVAFYKKHGHSRVPQKKGVTTPLERWVRNMRSTRQKLPPEKIRLLQDVDFIWKFRQISP